MINNPPIISSYNLRSRIVGTTIQAETVDKTEYVSYYNLRPRSYSKSMSPSQYTAKHENNPNNIIRRKNIKSVQLSKQTNIRNKNILHNEKIRKQNRTNLIEKHRRTNWESFNEYINVNPDGECDFYKEYVSATYIRNYLLNDPIIDWLKLYYNTYGYGDCDIVSKKLKKNISTRCTNKKLDVNLTTELAVLFQKGNEYEENIISALRERYPGQVVKISNDNKNVVHSDMQITFSCMCKGVPIIEQAPLYNDLNRTWGVADLIIRSDFINRIFEENVIPLDMEKVKAPKLNGNYHYIVIDIKWTTLMLRSNGIHILNSHRFPAYKGQLAIYTAAIGQLQGYTPNKAFILAKAWSSTKCGKKSTGYNSFGKLGEVDFSNFDNQILKRSKEAIKWIRELKYHGHKWCCLPPSRNELRPNMSNKDDASFGLIKKDLAEKQDEITSIWMLGTKHRNIAINKGVVSWSVRQV
jgi:hypothetical protein